MVFRTSATVWLLTAAVGGNALGAGVVGLRTDAGRDVVTRYAVAVLNQVVQRRARQGCSGGTRGPCAGNVEFAGPDVECAAKLTAAERGDFDLLCVYGTWDREPNRNDKSHVKQVPVSRKQRTLRLWRVFQRYREVARSVDSGQFGRGYDVSGWGRLRILKEGRNYQ